MGGLGKNFNFVMISIKKSYKIFIQTIKNAGLAWVCSYRYLT